MPNNQNDLEIISIIESALDLTGKGSKQIILDYINARYGMNKDLIVQYKDEFENYLRETLGDTAEIIISKINDNVGNNITNTHSSGSNLALSEHSRKGSHNPVRQTRIANVVHFIICNNCFWCASILDEHYESKCPSCNNEIISAVPVMQNENFLVEVDKKRGISLTFR